MNSLIPIVSIIALLIFAYMRNKQAARNDKRRERLEEMQVRLLETLQSSKKQPDGTKADTASVDEN